MSETPKAPATTAPVDFIVPNQDLYEKVIDQRLAAHASAEKPASKTTRTSAAAKEVKAEEPKAS